MRVFFSNRLKSHLSTLEPQLDDFKAKYDTAIREKMVLKVEKEKLQSDLNTSKLNTATMFRSRRSTMVDGVGIARSSSDETDDGLGPTQSKLRDLRLQEEKRKSATTNEQRRSNHAGDLTSEPHPRVRRHARVSDVDLLAV